MHGLSETGASVSFTVAATGTKYAIPVVPESHEGSYTVAVTNVTGADDEWGGGEHGGDRHGAGFCGSGDTVVGRRVARGDGEHGACQRCECAECDRHGGGGTDDAYPLQTALFPLVVLCGEMEGCPSCLSKRSACFAFPTCS